MKKSTKNQIKAEFFEFLRENDCASKFCVNFYSKSGKRFRNIHFGYGCSKTISEHMNTYSEEEWVHTAFSWRFPLNCTQNHFKFWDTISEKWRLRLCAINYNIQKSKDETNSH